jgi:hypothetical protein
MLYSSTLLAGITLATAASAAPVSSLPRSIFGSAATSPTSYGSCTQSVIPITVNVATTNINLAKPKSQAEVTGFLARYWATGSTVGQQASPPNPDGSLPRTAKRATYKVFTQLCLPNNWKDGGVVHIGTHG